MFTISRTIKALAIAIAFGGAAMFATSAIADKIILKDGTVLQGKVVREGKEFVFFKVKVGTVESERFIRMDEIKTIERDDPAPKTPEDQIPPSSRAT